MVAELEAKGFKGQALVDEVMRILGVDEGEARTIVANAHGGKGDDVEIEIIED